MKSWELYFRAWAQPAPDDECRKSKRAETAVTAAIRQCSSYKDRVSVFVQGSYKNDTNVQLDSDVDICVCDTQCVHGFADKEQAKNPPYASAGVHAYEVFKSAVSHALFGYFRFGVVTRGKKAFDVHADAHRIHADVVPCFVYKYHYSRSAYYTGVAFVEYRTDYFSVNFPMQSYENGLSKDLATARRFKPLVRIFKHLRLEMQRAGYASAYRVSSFVIESLLWNLPNELFMRGSLEACVRAVVSAVSDGTTGPGGSFLEINGIKPLFERWHEPSWGYIRIPNRYNATSFMRDASRYVGLHEDSRAV